MSNCIGMGTGNIAIKYSEELYAKRDGIEYSFFDSIPEGEGLMKTDLKRIWFEPFPEPEKPPTPEPTIEEKMMDLKNDNALLREQLIQMDSAMSELLLNVIPSILPK